MTRSSDPFAFSSRQPGRPSPSPTLDRTAFPAWRDRIAAFDAEQVETPPRPRSYPGYPTSPLPRPRRHLRPSLDRALQQRRSVRALDVALPSAADLGRVLFFGHGVHRDRACGPVPSAGGLQALELYLVTFESSWLAAGIHHYDREAHVLARLAPSGPESAEDGALWHRIGCERDHVPALTTVSGGALLWLVVGDGARARRKYDVRADHFLALEAGHLMQNLCLLSAAVGLSTVPLGGYYERAIARALSLPDGDLVLYAGVCGAPRE